MSLSSSGSSRPIFSDPAQADILSSSCVYNGKQHDHMEKLQNVVKGISTHFSPQFSHHFVLLICMHFMDPHIFPPPHHLPGLPDLKKVVVIPYVLSRQETDLSKIPNRSVHHVCLQSYFNISHFYYKLRWYFHLYAEIQFT